MIDSLGSPGTHIDSVETPLTDAEIDDVRASGLTAINMTVGGPISYDETVRTIAYWNAEIAAHLDVFLLVRHAADIAEAIPRQAGVTRLKAAIPHKIAPDTRSLGRCGLRRRRYRPNEIFAYGFAS